MESIFDCFIFKNQAGNARLFCVLCQANLAAITLTFMAMKDLVSPEHTHTPYLVFTTGIPEEPEFSRWIVHIV